MSDSRVCGCGKPLLDTPNVRAMLELWDEVDHYGNLHVVVDDGNLKDEWIRKDPAGPTDYRTAREMVLDNDSKASPDEVARELKWVEILERSTEEERFAAYGICWDCYLEQEKILDSYHEGDDE